VKSAPQQVNLSEDGPKRSISEMLEDGTALSRHSRDLLRVLCHTVLSLESFE
jgi:hypothetical protein